MLQVYSENVSVNEDAQIPFTDVSVISCNKISCGFEYQADKKSYSLTRERKNSK